MKSAARLTESWSQLTYPAGALLVVAGIPGAGKSTLIRRLFSSEPVRVLDPESIRRRYRSRLGSRVPYRLYRPLVHIEHYARLARAMRRPGSLVIHETATRGWVRRWIARCAQRPAHLLLLDVDLDAAKAGQRQRGRQISPKALTRHWQGWQRMRRQLAADPCCWLRREGYSSAVVLDRAGAEELAAVRFDRCTRAQPPLAESG